MDPGTLLGEIHMLRFGQSVTYGNGPFFQDLCVYQKSLARARKDTVSIPAIRSWLASERRSVPKRADAMRFLSGYVRWIASKGLVAHPNAARTETIIRILERYDPVEAEPSANATTEQSASEPAPARLDPIISATFQSIVAASNRNPRPVANDLFHNSDSRQEADHSYFLLYRYSTNEGTMLKSFLVCQKPEKGLIESYGFNHFVWGGVKHEFRQNIFRECEGLLLRFEKSYYFLGYNYVVPADKRHDPELYRELRLTSKERPNGLGLIAAEFDDIHLRPGLFGGITMTLAAANQPIAARVAFLHLGTRSRMGMEVRDTDVEPSELRIKDMATDLRGVVERLKAKGCKQFGIELELRSRRNDWSKAGCSALSKEIRDMIQNLPNWETENAKKNSKAQKRDIGSLGRGALETFGHLRD